MKIQTITVEIHEKRNHPHGEYSHYDARVSLTAELLEDEDAAEAVKLLQFRASQHVAVECDRWAAEIEREQKVAEAKNNIDWIIRRTEDDGTTSDKDAVKLEASLAILSFSEQNEYRAKLEAAKQTYLASIRERLEQDIQAAQRRRLSARGHESFGITLDHLPEAERIDYRTRMEAARAPKAEVPLAENEEDIAF